MSVPQNTIVQPFYDNFTDIIEETSKAENSGHGWLHTTSGAFFNVSKGFLRTAGQLSPGHPWQVKYADNIDTEGGVWPSNIARILTRQATFQDVTFSARFKITRLSLSESPNRTPDKGISLFTHYQTENDLYVAGVRHDGQAFIKRKLGSVYTTLGIIPWYAGTWNKTTHPSLLPQNTEFSLKVQIKSLNGVSSITLWITDPGTMTYRQALTVSDNSPSLAVPGRLGIRGDFCVFDVSELSLV